MDALLIGTFSMSAFTFGGTIYFNRRNLITAKYIDTITTHRIRRTDAIRNEVADIATDIDFSLNAMTKAIDDKKCEHRDLSNNLEYQSKQQWNLHAVYASIAFQPEDTRLRISDLVYKFNLLKLNPNVDKEIIDTINYFIRFYTDGEFKFDSDLICQSKIVGTQEWMTENLSVDCFQNGDPISEVKTEEDWEKAVNEGRPAWRYKYEYSDKGEWRFKYKHIRMNYGKLYNIHVLSDAREIAPMGWHIPSNDEWMTRLNYLKVNPLRVSKFKAHLFFKSYRFFGSKDGPFYFFDFSEPLKIVLNEKTSNNIMMDCYNIEKLKYVEIEICCIKD